MPAPPPQSSSSTPAAVPAARQPKTMSSRLLTMKFMQRASSSQQSFSTPSPSPGIHASKKQKFSHTPSTPSSLGSTTPTSTVDALAVAGAPFTPSSAETEERGHGRETKWSFSYRVEEQPALGGNGTGQVKIEILGSRPEEARDREVGGGRWGGERREDEGVGRRMFGAGKWKRRLNGGGSSGDANPSTSISANADRDSGLDSLDDDSSDNGSNASGDNSEEGEIGADVDAMIKAQRKAQGKAQRRAQGEANGKPFTAMKGAVSRQKQEQERSREEVRLKKLTSISGAGGGGKKRDMSNVECHACGQKGHVKWDCPTRKGLPY